MWRIVMIFLCFTFSWGQGSFFVAALYITLHVKTLTSSGFFTKEYDKSITGNALNDIRLIGCVTSVFLLGIVVIGMEWESKVSWRPGLFVKPSFVG